MAGNTKRQFDAGVMAELRRRNGAPAPLTNTAVEKLPAPVARYLRRCGYANKGHIANAKFFWHEAQLKRAPDADWMRLHCLQFNFVAAPARIVYMKGATYGIFTLEGLDRYQDGRGSMLIRLMRLFTVNDTHTPQMDRSALVTVLSEALLVPSCAVQPYISWTPIDDRAARAALAHNGVTVEGTFYFNERDEFVRFTTSDRFLVAPGAGEIKASWTVTASDYRHKEGIRRPTDLRAIWNKPEGDYEYFRGLLAGIEFNAVL